MNAKVKITLEDTLVKAGISRNAVAVQGRVRPATVSELCTGKSKSLSFKTLEDIVDALNTLDKSKLYGIHDILTIEYKE